MASSTLDLFVLTFNCAKNLINAAVFASHLQAAFQQNATALPEVVVFSLQEIAPISYSFIGGYFTSPYFARFEEALNLAATQFEAKVGRQQSSHDDSSSSSSTRSDPDAVIVERTTSSSSHPSPTRPYTLVRARNVGMTAIMLFARDPAALQDIQEAEVGFGAAEMGNKGAAGLRMLFTGSDAENGGGSTGSLPGTSKSRSTELTFVATHLAAMEWNLPRRNANWAAIMRGLTFENPEAVLDPKKKAEKEAIGANAPGAHGVEGAGQEAEMERRHQRQHEGALESDEEPESDSNERRRLLHEEHRVRDKALQDQLHDISVFKPSSHLFVAGDLNYRISSSSPPPMADFPNLDPDSPHHYSTFLGLDQLTRERKAGRTLHGLSEADIKFPPTYKYNVLPVDGGGRATTSSSKHSDEQPEDVPWVFAPHRYPSWTDRILFLDVPGEKVKGKRSKKNDKSMQVKAYDALPVVRTSDHRPVFLRVDVPLLSPEEMRSAVRESAEPDSFGGSSYATELDGATTSDEEGDDTRAATSGKWSGVDPRATLPVAIDPEAWERRAAARQREVLAGWSMFLWSTKEGALVIATMLAVGVGGWWLVRGMY